VTEGEDRELDPEHVAQRALHVVLLLWGRATRRMEIDPARVLIGG
jgi:hypothetical protein